MAADAMAKIFFFPDSIRDAKAERTPYFWSMVTDPTGRSVRLHEGVAATAKIILLAIVLDAIYLIIRLKIFDVAKHWSSPFFRRSFGM
jgi:hypothetical protein